MRDHLMREPLSEARLKQMRTEAKCDPRCVDEHWFILFARLIEAALPTQSPWQPIETAPKDGTQFLAAWGDRVIVTYWLDNTKTATPWAGWRVPSMTTMRPGECPTFWQPLPTAPGAAA